VIDMALLSVIRRWHFRDEMPIREIERRTGLSRNTIRKYLRGGTVEPRFKVPDRPSKLDPFAEKLSGWLRTEVAKSRKQRRTAKQMHADLVVLGFDGSYGRVAAFVRAWKAERQREAQTSGRGTFVPLVFAAGEAFQFDWSEDWAMLGGRATKLQVAHTKLSHSRAFAVRAYPLQTHEMLFDALTQAFRVLGGVPGRGIFDNMKTAVDRIGAGKDPAGQCPVRGDGEPLSVRARVLQPGFRLGEGAGREERPGCAAAVVAAHAQLPRSGRAERLAGGAVHRAVERDRARRAARHRRRCPRRRGGQSDAAGSAVRRLRRTHQASIADLPRELRAQPLQRTGIVRQPAGQPADLPDRIVSPPRVNSCASTAGSLGDPITGGRTVYDWRHYLAVIQRKPGALRNGAPFAEMPDAFRQLQSQILRRPGGDREMAEILALVLQHDEQVVLCAVELALEAGVATKTHVLNVLHRLIDGKAPPASPIDAPQALRLAQEPLANVGRYDALRDGGLRHAS
jgi:transposase